MSTRKDTDRRRSNGKTARQVKSTSAKGSQRGGRPHGPPQLIDPTDSKHLPPALRRAAAYIHDNYAKPASVPAIAEAVGLRERTLYRLFHDWLGLTPNGYVTRCRVKRVVEILDGEPWVKAIDLALAAGYESIPYLYGVFRDHMGCTISEYRETIRNEANGRNES